MCTNTIRTTTHLEQDDLYKTEKPYSLRFTPPEEFPHQNTRLEEHDIEFQDVREYRPLSFEKEGSIVISIQSQMEYDDFDDDEKVKDRYLKEVANILRQFLGASKVQVFDHRVRKRAINFPIATGEPFQYDQATSIVHIGV